MTSPDEYHVKFPVGKNGGVKVPLTTLVIILGILLWFTTELMDRGFIPSAETESGDVALAQAESERYETLAENLILEIRTIRRLMETEVLMEDKVKGPLLSEMHKKINRIYRDHVSGADDE